MDIAQIPIEYLSLSPLRRAKPLPRITARAIRAIQHHGIITPIIARPISTPPPERYEILAGENRWLAAQRAGLQAVPVWIRRDLSATEAEQLVRRTLQSEGARLLEEATAAKQLVQQGLRITEVALRTGRTRSALAHLLRLLKLCGPVKQLLIEGHLKFGHARPLVGLSNADQIHLAKRIVHDHLSAREAEQLARECKTDRIPPTGQPGEQGKDPNLLRLEQRLGEQIGSPVTINYDGQSRGQLVIEFHNLEILDGLLERLGYEG